MRETQSSKVDALQVLNALRTIFESENPLTTDFSAEDRFAVQPDKIECPKCQTLVDVNTKFCSECGHSIKDLVHANA